MAQSDSQTLPLPGLSLAIIRQHADPEVFRRGQEYQRRGARWDFPGQQTGDGDAKHRVPTSRLAKEVETMDDGSAVRDDTVTLDGLRFHYRDWGDPNARPLVLLHGYTSHARSWDTFARGMADRFWVLALDLRGHGESAWASDYHEQRLLGDLEGFVAALGLRTFSAVGFSIGGYAAAGYAALHPDRVERLVLAECFALETDQVTAAHIQALRALPVDYRGSAEDAAAAAAAAYRPLAPDAPEDELRRWMHAGLKQEPDGRWTWRYDPVFRVPGPPGRLNPSPAVFADRLARVVCPTLLVVGETSFHAEGAEQVAPVNPRTRLVRVPRAGHWAPLDNPRGFLEVVDRFLNPGA